MCLVVTLQRIFHVLAIGVRIHRDEFLQAAFRDVGDVLGRSLRVREGGHLLGAEGGGHGVDEHGVVGVAVRGDVDVGDVEGGHHVVVFVDEIVAVKHVDSRPGGEVGDQLYAFCGNGKLVNVRTGKARELTIHAQVDDIFQGCCFVGFDNVAAPGSFYNLEVD